MPRKTASKAPRVRDGALSEFRVQPDNLNDHSQRGMSMLDESMGEDGYVAPMSAAANGDMMDGSARLETVAERFAGIAPIVIEHDGTRPIVAVRTDIPNGSTLEAQRIALRANRVGQVNLRWNVERLAALKRDRPELVASLFLVDELAGILKRADADGHNAGADALPQQFMILVECADEAQQTELLTRYTAEGLTCRALIL